MKVEAKKLDASKVQLDIEVPQETVKKKFEEVYEKVGKEARIPGFRPGKAPKDILEKHHGRLIQDEVIKGLIPEAYRGSIEKEKIDVVEMPEISQVKLESNILSFRAVVEVKPQIEIKEYKNIKLKYKKIAVGPQEIDKSLDSFKESHKISALDDKFAKGLGYKTLADMRASIERRLLTQKEDELRRQLQDDLLKQILDKARFRVPPSLIAQRLEELVKDAKVQLAIRQVPREQIASHDEKLRKELLPEAETQVKTFLVLEEIAKKENITDAEHLTQRTIEFLLSEANWIEE
ncbi:MAG: trigger factor [Candidatus Omnitrophota bacterium]|nr:trigger factor [Candidatus Omnitrophota bacterium]